MFCNGTGKRGALIEKGKGLILVIIIILFFKISLFGHILKTKSAHSLFGALFGGHSS